MWQTVRREELYGQVWSMPLSQLCEKYGLSDNGLRKVCKRLNVPVPARGYWAKVEAGHKVRKTALPSVAEQSSTQIWRQAKREKTVADEGDVAWLKERVAFEADAAHAIEVVASRKRWHPAIAPLHEFLDQEAREIEASRKAQERYDAWPESRKQRESGPDRMAWLWYERAGQLLPTTHHATVARLSLDQYRRGLAILNAVAVAATKRGFEVKHDEKKGRVMLVGHGGKLELRMSEATEQETRKVKRYDGKFEDERLRVPTGRLRIFVERGYGKVWTCEERVEAPLEAKLNALFVGVWKQVVLCRQKTRDEEARARREAVLTAERAEVERRAWEEERRAAAERARRSQLVAEAKRWRRAADIRAYVGAVQAQAEGQGGAAVSRITKWAGWALAVADEVDPLVTKTTTGRECP